MLPSRSFVSRRWRLALVLEGNFVVVWLGRFSGLRRRSRLAASASIFFGGFTCGASRTTAQQLHALAHHATFAPLFTGLLVSPAVHLQTAFDENGPAFP